MQLFYCDIFALCRFIPDYFINVGVSPREVGLNQGLQSSLITQLRRYFVRPTVFNSQLNEAERSIIGVFPRYLLNIVVKSNTIKLPSNINALGISMGIQPDQCLWHLMP